MCNAGFGLSLECAACITYAWRVASFMRACLRVAASAKAGGQKTFLLNLYRLTKGRGAYGPESAVPRFAGSGYLA